MTYNEQLEDLERQLANAKDELGYAQSDLSTDKENLDNHDNLSATKREVDNLEKKIEKFKKKITPENANSHYLAPLYEVEEN